MPSTSFRPLRPRWERSQDQQPSPPAEPAPTTKPRRSGVIAACESCRERKTKCDAKRPKCSACTSSGRECIYSTAPSESRGSALKRKYGELESQVRGLRESHEPLQRLLHALQTRKDADAVAIFRKIRQGENIESIVRHIGAGDLLLQLQVTPETRYRYEFPYSPHVPISMSTPNNPYLNTLIYEATFPTSNPGGTSNPFFNAQYRPQYLKPFLAARIVDSRLDSVKPSNWTSVSTDDDLMRTLLRLYFLYEHQWLTSFHKDHFLDDMLSGSKRFCSSLLVNVVLAHACNCYHAFSDRLEYWNPHNLGYRFFAEAKRLWEMERMEETCLTTIQAASMINIMYIMYSMDKLGMTYGVQAVAMANKLGLFGPTTQFKSKRKRISYGFTAWCLFYSLNVQCYHFCLPPLIKDPPKAALPDPDLDPGWYGEFWVQYPLNETPCPMHYGHFFKAKQEIVTICHSIATVMFDKDTGQAAQSSPQLIGNFALELRGWFASLPASLTPTNIVFPSHLKLHLLYHNVMINLCELLVSLSDKFAAGPLQSPHSVLEHSKICFETLIRLYYLRHGFESSDTYMAHSLTVMAFMALSQLKQLASSSDPLSMLKREDARASLILAAKGLSDQGRNYYFPYTLFHVVKAATESEDLELLYKSVNLRKENTGWDKLRAKHVQAQYPCNILSITDFREEQRLSNLIKEYADLALGDQSPGRESDTSNGT
ncbi:nitrate assimilation regulatory protein nirA [Rhizodiscina lignyota]|uniref:Nitrate assimilation regulatory protein nirA n=1 Tax=Rhizodiscina lignyota TaxID=1504668 RepID=A0A9P4IBS3_9PEZI|nr:nitrate assimilation regulatory protein nirA [Rhizodiscina lignyota]